MSDQTIEMLEQQIEHWRGYVNQGKKELYEAIAAMSAYIKEQMVDIDHHRADYREHMQELIGYPTEKVYWREKWSYDPTHVAHIIRAVSIMRQIQLPEGITTSHSAVLDGIKQGGSDELIVRSVSELAKTVPANGHIGGVVVRKAVQEYKELHKPVKPIGEQLDAIWKAFQREMSKLGELMPEAITDAELTNQQLTGLEELENKARECRVAILQERAKMEAAAKEPKPKRKRKAKEPEMASA
jgi:hypothetical protein